MKPRTNGFHYTDSLHAKLYRISCRPEGVRIEFRRDGKWEVTKTLHEHNLAKGLRTIIRKAGVALLVALARADRDTGAAEVEEIVFFCERACTAEELDLTGAERERLAAYVARLRPTPEAVDGTLDILFESGNEVIANVLRAGMRVVRADGALREEEAVMLDTFCYALTGRHVR